MRVYTRPTVKRIPLGMGGSRGLGDDGDFDFSQLASDISAATTGTANIIKATETPYVIPGTNVLYNPAGGAVASSTPSLTVQSTSWVMPAMLIVGGLAVLMILMRK